MLARVHLEPWGHWAAPWSVIPIPMESLTLAFHFFFLESIFPWKFKAEIPIGKVPSLFGLRLAQHFLSEELETNCWEMKAEGGGNMG